MSNLPPPPPPAPHLQGPSPETPVSKAKPLGKIALGTAIVGLVFACIPGALVVGWVLLPIAFILAIVALFQPGPKWAALAGLIVSIVGTIIGFVVFLVVVVDAVDDAVEEATDRPSDFAVTIDGTEQGKDYEGKPALLVDLTFTNNDDEDASYLWSLTATAYQNGVELEQATLSGDGDANNAKDIRPGTSIQVQDAFILNDDSDVTIEVREAISLNERVLAEETVTVEAKPGEAFGEAHSEYDVTIDGSRQTTDYEGKPVLQVDFTFTNNGDDAQSFLFAADVTAFQNGTELEDAYVDSESTNGSKEIKPGRSIKAQQSFVLDGKGDVTIEVTGLISLDDTLLATRTFPVR
ncbi:MAG TPA: DUF5067 domain-containing protein [Nocardioides sp.]|nr:DUF5067 domain-containing protein [Nocardioides sp.]